MGHPPGSLVTLQGIPIRVRYLLRRSIWVVFPLPSTPSNVIKRDNLHSLLSIKLVPDRFRNKYLKSKQNIKQSVISCQPFRHPPQNIRKSLNEMTPTRSIHFFSILYSRDLIVEFLRERPNFPLIDDDSLLVMMNLTHRRDDRCRPAPKCLL